MKLRALVGSWHRLAGLWACVRTRSILVRNVESFSYREEGARGRDDYPAVTLMLSLADETRGRELGWEHALVERADIILGQCMVSAQCQPTLVSSPRIFATNRDDTLDNAHTLTASSESVAVDREDTGLTCM